MPYLDIDGERIPISEDDARRLNSACLIFPCDGSCDTAPRNNENLDPPVVWHVHVGEDESLDAARSVVLSKIGRSA